MEFNGLVPFSRPRALRAFDDGAMSNPGTMLWDLNRQINRLFDEFFPSAGLAGSEEAALPRLRAAIPAMEVITEDDRYEVMVELPGVRQDDVEITLRDHVLTIRGEKKRVREAEDKSWSERFYGRFERSIQLPGDVDEDKIDASFADGVLQIIVPRVEEKVKGRRIELKKRDEKRSGKLIDDKATRIEEHA